MQFTITTLAVVAFSGLAASQLSAIPACAQPCLLAALTKSPCSATDTACQCEPANHALIQAGAQTCVENACTTAEILQTLSATTALCSSSSSSSSSSSASSSSAAPPPASSLSAASTSSAPASSSSAPATLTTTASTTSTECPCEETSPTAASNGTSTPSIVPYNGGASQVAATFGSMLAIGFAVLAAF